MFMRLWRRRRKREKRYHLEQLHFFMLCLVVEKLLKEDWYYAISDKYKFYGNADHLSVAEVVEIGKLFKAKISSLIKEK